MKVAIAFPPVRNEKNQLRNWGQDFSVSCPDSYPLVAASAATLLKAKGYEVSWIDAGAEGWSYRKFINVIKRERPDIIAIQAKTSQVKNDWRVINDLKAAFTDSWFLTIVLMGDHVTALPEESFNNSQVDFVLTGGDFDFLLLNLCSQLSYDNPNPFLGLEPGIWYRHGGKIRSSGGFKLNHDLSRLPLIDRELTKWRLYCGDADHNQGLYLSWQKWTAGDKVNRMSKRAISFTMVARNCSWGQPSLSSASVLYPGIRFRTRSAGSLLNEIGLLIEKYKINEIYDLSSSFPSGSWLRSFCQGMISKEYNQKVKLGCWMRPGTLTKEDWQLMKQAGFRKIFFMVESVNNRTMEILGRDVKSQQLFENVRSAKRAGLQPHLSVMVGFPWEGDTEIQKTVEFTRRLFVEGWADGLEGRVVTPYPGTNFYQQCKQRGWLRTEDWDLYDDEQVVVSCSLDEESVLRIARGLSRQPVTPRFFIRKIASLNWLAKLINLFSSSRAVTHLKEMLNQEKEFINEEEEDDKARSGPGRI